MSAPGALESSATIKSYQIIPDRILDSIISPIESAERGFATSLNWLKKVANDG